MVRNIKSGLKSFFTELLPIENLYIHVSKMSSTRGFKSGQGTQSGVIILIEKLIVGTQCFNSTISVFYHF